MFVHHLLLFGSQLTWGVSACQGIDQLTTALAELLELTPFLRLQRSEQLGFVMIATYLRSSLFLSSTSRLRNVAQMCYSVTQSDPRFAKHLVSSCTTMGKAFSLVNAISSFFLDTEGFGKRKAFLPSRKVKKGTKARFFAMFLFMHRAKTIRQVTNELHMIAQSRYYCDRSAICAPIVMLARQS